MMGKGVLSFYKNYKKKGVLFSWIISYITILLIPTIATIVIYYRVDGVVRNQVNKSNSVILKMVQQSLDSRLSEAKKLGLQVAKHNSINSLRIDREPIEQENWYSFSRMTNDFLSYTASNEFITDFYIYIHNTNVILKPGGSTYLDILYKSMHENQNFTYNQWKQLLDQKHQNTFVSLPNASEDDTHNNSIAYITSLPVNGFPNPFATLVVLMNQKLFFESLQNLDIEAQGGVLIIDDNDSIVASTRNFNLPQGIKYSDLSEDSGLLYHKINGEKMAVSYISSRVAKWKYAIIIPERLFWQKLQHVKMVIIISTFCYLLFGILLAHFWTEKNYNPLRELIHLLTNNTGMSIQEECNEYYFIKNTILDSFEEKEKIYKKLEQQNNTLRQNFLTRLIKGRIGSEVSLEEAFSAHNIEFLSDNFAVMLFYIEDFNRVFDGKEKHVTEQDIELIHFIIQNVVEELISRNHQGFVVEVDEMLVCLINLKQLDRDNGNSELIQIATEAKQFIENNFYIYFTVAISGVQHSVQEIAHAYQNAMEAMEYRLLNPQGGIILYDQIKAANKNEYSYYSLEMEYQLINCIKIGDFEKAKIILNEVFDVTFKKSMSIAMVRCLMFDLISTMVKTMSELSIVCESAFLDSLNPIERLLKCETLQEMKNEIVSILENVSNYINEKKKSHNHELKDRIINFVHQNYSDPDLSIAAIGKSFNMNSAYLSRFFKEQTGEVLLDLINKIRIEKVKELMKSDELSVSEAAVRVGYYNNISLIRAFKKYEGITPGKYKENL